MLRGVLLIALASVSWGTTGSVGTILVAGAGAHPLLIGTARMWVAAVLLLAGARLAAGPLAPARREAWRWILMGLCMAGYQAAYFTAVTLTGIAVTALIAICSAPLAIAALARGFLGEPLGPGTLAALGLGVGGTALLVGGPAAAGADPARTVAGALLALGAGLAYAVYVVVAKAGLARTAPLPLTAATFAVAAVAMTPALAWVPAPLAQAARGWPWLLYLGAVATAGAYALYAAGLRQVPAAAAGVVTLLEPLTATLLGVLAFGERFSAAGVVGAALLLAALTLLLRSGSASTPPG